MTSLKQRVAYLNNLIRDAGISDYGITESEIQALAARPITETLSLILELKKLTKK